MIASIALQVRELRAAVRAAGLDERGCAEKADFVRQVLCAVFTRLPSGWRHIYSGQPVKKCAIFPSGCCASTTGP